MNNQLKIPPYLQVIIHILCTIFYNAQAQDLFSDEKLAKWVICVVGSVQSVLAIYGVFSPAPPNKSIEPKQ